MDQNVHKYIDQIHRSKSPFTIYVSKNFLHFKSKCSRSNYPLTDKNLEKLAIIFFSKLKVLKPWTKPENIKNLGTRAEHCGHFVTRAILNNVHTMIPTKHNKNIMCNNIMSCTYGLYEYGYKTVNGHAARHRQKSFDTCTCNVQPISQARISIKHEVT